MKKSAPKKQPTQKPRRTTWPKKVLALLPRRITWEWTFLLIVLIILGAYLAGHNLFGMDNYVTGVLAMLGLLMAPLLTFIIFPIINLLLATLILPLITFVMGALAALSAALVALIAPLISLVTGLWAWLLSTALGQAIIAPLYNLVAPLVFKIAPWLTTTGYARKGWSILKKFKKF